MLHPASWQRTRIGEIADIVGGGTPPTRDLRNFDGEIPWLTPKDLSKPHDRYIARGERSLSQLGLSRSSAHLLPKGTVLLTTRAPIGYVAIANNVIATNQGFRNLVTRDTVIPEYLYYWLKQNTDELKRHASGSTFGELSGSSLKQIELFLPSLVEQRSITQILGDLDNRVELNRRLNITLEAMVQALFEDWFFRFGPVRAKINGDPIYLPNDLWGLFPDDFDEYGIPVGWSQNELGTLFDVRIGRTPPRKERHHFLSDGGGVTWLSIKAMKDIQAFALSSEENLTEDAVQEFRIPLITAQTVLVSFKLTVGRVAIAGKNMCSNEAIAQLRPVDQTPVSYPFTYCYMKAFDYDSLASTSSIATAVNSKSIKAIRMTIPDPAIHTTFVKIAEPIFDQILLNCRESDSITSIRDILLPKLISGEIRVKDAENIVKSIP